MKKSGLMIGPRRAGKTTFLKHTFPDWSYISLDDYDNLMIAEDDPKHLLEISGKYIIVDEVQRVPKLLVAIKYAIDEQGRQVWMTGSSTLGLLSKGAETLAGRIVIQECPTLCWGEEHGVPTHALFEMPPDPRQIQEASRKLEHVLHFGGFPEVVTSTTDEEKSEVLKNYKNTYFTRDLLLLSNIENAPGLFAILNYLAVSIGSHTDTSNASRESNVSFPTAKKYLNVLEASRLVFKLYGYQFGPAKRYTKAAKHYFSDSGILTSLNVEVSQGQRLENFVVSEIEKRRKLGALQADQLFYYKSAGGAEIDIIIEEPRIITAIEIKNSINPAHSDVRNLEAFIAENGRKKRRGILLYRGTDRLWIGKTELLPIAHLFRAG